MFPHNLTQTTDPPSCSKIPAPSPLNTKKTNSHHPNFSLRPAPKRHTHNHVERHPQRHTQHEIRGAQSRCGRRLCPPSRPPRLFRPTHHRHAQLFRRHLPRRHPPHNPRQCQQPPRHLGRLHGPRRLQVPPPPTLSPTNPPQSSNALNTSNPPSAPPPYSPPPPPPAPSPPSPAPPPPSPPSSPRGASPPSPPQRATPTPPSPSSPRPASKP